MGIVRITEEDVKKNVRNYRIKQTFFVLGVMAVSVIIIVSLIVYLLILRYIRLLTSCTAEFSSDK